MGMKTPAGNDPDTCGGPSPPGAATAGTIERWDASALPVQFACEVKDFDATPYFGSEGSPSPGPRHPTRLRRGRGRLADAGDVGADPSRCAVIAATGVGGLETMELNESTFLARGASRVSPFFVTMMMPNATAGVISINFGGAAPTSASRPRAYWQLFSSAGRSFQRWRGVKARVPRTLILKERLLPVPLSFSRVCRSFPLCAPTNARCYRLPHISPRF